MPRGYRSVVVSIGLIAGLAQAQDASDSPQWQAEQQQHPAQTLPLPLPVEIIENQAAADARERSESEARQREIDDLVAQQGMNAATQAMNEATQKMVSDNREMVNATWVGVVLLFVTLLLTLQANRAAVRAVEITDKIGKAQTRSYLHVAENSIEELPSIDIDSTQELTINFKIVNKGQTPAFNFRYIGGVMVGGFATTFTDEEISPHPGQATPDATLEAGGVALAVAKSFPIVRSDLRDAFLAESTKRMFLVGRIFYDDVFGDPHHTQFCYFLEPIQRIEDEGFSVGECEWRKYHQYNRAT